MVAVVCDTPRVGLAIAGQNVIPQTSLQYAPGSIAPLDEPLRLDPAFGALGIRKIDESLRMKLVARAVAGTWSVRSSHENVEVRADATYSLSAQYHE